MKSDIKILKDFGSLDKGMDLQYNPKKDAYVFSSRIEDNGQGFKSVRTKNISLSPDYVENYLLKEGLAEYISKIEVPDSEVSSKSNIIKNFEDRLNKIQEELRILKGESNG